MLEKDRLRYRRDKEDPEKMEAICARKQIAMYCKACGCCIRKYQWGRECKKTATHIRNGGPEMEEEERKMKEEEEERKRKEEEEKKKLEEAEENIKL